MSLGTFHIRSKIISGEGSSEKIVDYIKSLGKDRILVLTDKGIRSTGLPDKIKEKITQAGMSCVIYDSVQPDPTVDLIDEIASEVKNSINGIVAIGGGSTIDTAKGVSIVSTHGGSIRDYVGENKFASLAIPIIAIPTTAGTGSEVSWHISVNDLKNEKKITVRNSLCSCELAILDPTVMQSIPKHVAAMTGVDAFTHNYESFVSNNGNWLFTHQLAKSAMELIGGNLLSFVENPANNVAAEKMLLASSIGGMVLSHSRTGIVHQMARPLGAHFHVPHGLAVSLILPHAMDYVADSIKEKLEIVNSTLPSYDGLPQVEPHKQAVFKVKHLISQLPIPNRLRDVNVTEDKLEQMAIDSLQGQDFIFNPTKVDLENVINIYRSAY